MIPCGVRREVLEKVNVNPNEDGVGMADIIIPGGQEYNVLITNEGGRRSYFRCPAWREICQVLGVHEDGTLWLILYEPDNGRIFLEFSDYKPASMGPSRY